MFVNNQLLTREDNKLQKEFLKNNKVTKIDFTKPMKKDRNISKRPDKEIKKANNIIKEKRKIIDINLVNNRGVILNNMIDESTLNYGSSV